MFGTDAMDASFAWNGFGRFGDLNENQSLSRCAKATQASDDDSGRCPVCPFQIEIAVESLGAVRDAFEDEL